MRDFLLIGRRINFTFDTALQFDNDSWISQVRRAGELDGSLHSPLGVDYFLTPARSVPLSLPSLAVGRGGWDNLLVTLYRRRRIPVIDGTAMVSAYHPYHDYSHVEGGRTYAIYGAEAVANTVAGFLPLGVQDATHLLKGNRVVPARSGEALLRRLLWWPRLLPFVGRLFPYQRPKGTRQ
jgi:hypothetical protein